MGRNLDLEYSFGEKVAFTPRNYILNFKHKSCIKHHFAMLGMAYVQEGHPLYAEAVNEKGLVMAGLNFPGNAYYREPEAGADNIAPYEFIPWVLGQYRDIEEAYESLCKINITMTPFSENLPVASLHWMIADRSRCLVVEAEKDGIHIYDNPYGVLTNNPPFSYYLSHMGNYRNISSKDTGNRFSKTVNIPAYGQGLGAVGLPGDFSPVSRFVKAAFLKLNSDAPENESDNISQVFHILDSVAMIRGSVVTEEDRFDITSYSCCINAEKGIYYFKTYDNNAIQAVDMHSSDMDGDIVTTADITGKQQIFYRKMK